MDINQGYDCYINGQPYVTEASGVSTKIRPEVADFAIAMEEKLQRNDHKTGWRDQPVEAHIKLLEIEMMEFQVALEFLTLDEACKECVDIANFAMIIRNKIMTQGGRAFLNAPRDYTIKSMDIAASEP